MNPMSTGMPATCRVSAWPPARASFSYTCRSISRPSWLCCQRKEAAARPAMPLPTTATRTGATPVASCSGMGQATVRRDAGGGSELRPSMSSAAPASTGYRLKEQVCRDARQGSVQGDEGRLLWCAAPAAAAAPPGLLARPPRVVAREACCCCCSLAGRGATDEISAQRLPCCVHVPRIIYGSPYSLIHCASGHSRPSALSEAARGGGRSQSVQPHSAHCSPRPGRRSASRVGHSQQTRRRGA